MKLVQAKAFRLLLFGWLTVSIPVSGQDALKSVADNSLPEITLNGLTSFLNHKRALFKVRSPDGFGYGEIKSYYLAEGQREGGIELLSVDMKTGKIRVNNHGAIQTVTLCHPADLSTLGAMGNSSGNPSKSQISEMNSYPGTPLAGLQTAGTGGQLAGAGEYDRIGGRANESPGVLPLKDAAPSSDAMPGNDSKPVNDPSNSGNPNQNAKKGGYSLVAAREFERLRLQTAAAVYDGIAEPLPLTPLTPPNTPRALIGPDRAWFPED